MQQFNTKVDTWFKILLASMPFMGLVSALFDPDPEPYALMTVFFGIAIMVYLIYLYILQIRYIIKDGMLIIRYPFLLTRRFKLEHLDKVWVTRGSSGNIRNYATSLNKLALLFDGHKTIYISPEGQDAFVSALMKYNDKFKYLKQN